MGIRVKLTKKQVTIAEQAIKKVGDFFNRQMEELVMDEMPEMPVIRGEELYLPDDVDVVWAMIHSAGMDGYGVANKIDRALEGEIALGVRAVWNSFRD